MMQRLIVFFASGGYLGYAPVAPGTFGTLAGIPAVLLFDSLRELSTVVYLLSFVAFVAAACWIAGAAEHLFDEHDSGKIVIDEVAGYLATMLFIAPTLTNIAVAFFVFRIADIVKPWPASYIDAKVTGGAGVTLDDVVSGLYGSLLMHVLVALGMLS